MKKCSRCSEERPDDWYAKHSISKVDGRQLYKSYCRNCKTAGNRAERAERRLGKKTCVKCKELLDTAAFHTSQNGLKKACKACEAQLDRECRICRETKAMSAFRKNNWGGFRTDCYQCEGERKRTAEGRAAALQCYYVRAKDPTYRLVRNLRSTTRRVFKGIWKDMHTLELLGCTPEEYRVYMASKFQEGMTMENYGKGGWSIDHIVPLASIDIYNPEARAKALHYTNTQPLWEADNLRKGDKLPDGTLGRFLRPTAPLSEDAECLLCPQPLKLITGHP